MKAEGTVEAPTCLLSKPIPIPTENQHLSKKPIPIPTNVKNSILLGSLNIEHPSRSVPTDYFTSGPTASTLYHMLTTTNNSTRP
jgi:hypothetical protein